MKLVVHRADRVPQNGDVDPVVIALAQLVRDRWENERKERCARRHGLRLMEEKRR